MEVEWDFSIFCVVCVFGHKWYYMKISMCLIITGTSKFLIRFSGCRYRKYKVFVQPAINLSWVLAERKIHLVYGQGNRWLSRLVSEAAYIRGSQVLSIIPKALKALAWFNISIILSCHSRSIDYFHIVGTFEHL